LPSSDVPAGGSGDHSDHDDAQALADLDQTFADSDQTRADGDQTAADRDEAASTRDQRAADSDQRSADREHAARDPAIDDTAYDQSRRNRFQSALDRDLASEVRSESARLRDLHAERRDAAADARDRVARERDELFAGLELRDEREGGPVTSATPGERVVAIELLLRAARDRERAAALRDRLRALREAAACDREQAARDRSRAARDRQAAATEIAQQGMDHLTGALRRRAGLAAIQRELDRTARSGEPLAVAFVDIDGLKAVNNTEGHQAGDDLLRTVVHCIRGDLRSYDLVVRYGGDEFICSMSGQTGPEMKRRFDGIAEALAASSADGGFSVGIAEREADETLGDLIRRADDAMIAARAHNSL
jgi:diguanylate cyclase (GGDEF)-like protein